jgi:hypothetical protein
MVDAPGHLLLNKLYLCCSLSEIKYKYAIFHTKRWQNTYCLRKHEIILLQKERHNRIFFAKIIKSLDNIVDGINLKDVFY